MAIREVRQIGDEVLRKKCKPVKAMTPRTVTLIEDMFSTMYEAQGVGLAAPQVTYIMHELEDAGFDVDEDATTIEEAAKTIAEVLKQ